MVHFYSRKFVKCYLDQGQGQTLDTLHIEYEFTHAGQQDGHGPWHRDDARDFAECVMRNIEIEPIAAVLNEHNITGIGDIRGCSITVKPLNILDRDSFMPLNHMHIQIDFLAIQNTHASLANQLMNAIPWQVAKEGIFEGYSNSLDWDFGRQGSTWIQNKQKNDALEARHES